MKNITLTVLNDNVPRKGLNNTWGWSVYIQSTPLHILFDADTMPEIIEKNAKQLNIDLKTLNFAFLSHGHMDHYGGFKYVGAINPGLTIYVPAYIEYLKKAKLNQVLVSTFTELVKNVYSTGPIKSSNIVEHAMILKLENLGNLLIVGCSHPGIDTIAIKAKELGTIYMVIGGFHSPSRRAIDTLAKITELICPAHCTGDAAKSYIKTRYRDKYCEVQTGSVINISL